MELVQFAKKNNAIDILYQFLDNVENHYKQNQSFLGLDDYMETAKIGTEDDGEIWITFYIEDADQDTIDVHASTHMEDNDGEVIATGDDTVDKTLNLDTVKLLKRYVKSIIQNEMVRKPQRGKRF